MPISVIAEIVEEQDTRIWRIVKAHMNKAYQEKDMKDVTKVGVDETSSKKGHNYISVFIDMDERKVLFATKGKNAGTIKSFTDSSEKNRKLNKAYHNEIRVCLKTRVAL